LSLDRRDRQVVLGDLAEEYATRCRQDSSRTAVHGGGYSRRSRRTSAAGGGRRPSPEGTRMDRCGRIFGSLAMLRASGR
jgi:hypothetical protein